MKAEYTCCQHAHVRRQNVLCRGAWVRASGRIGTTPRHAHYLAGGQVFPFHRRRPLLSLQISYVCFYLFRHQVFAVCTRRRCSKEREYSIKKWIASGEVTTHPSTLRIDIQIQVTVHARQLSETAACPSYLPAVHWLRKMSSSSFHNLSSFFLQLTQFIIFLK
jgi:hypothetical protein